MSNRKSPQNPPIELPTMFAFSRSLSVGDGAMYGLTESNTRVPLAIEELSYKGVIGPFGAETDASKRRSSTEVNTSPSKNAHDANLQEGQDAHLPIGCHILLVTTSVVITRNYETPSAIDNLEFWRLCKNQLQSWRPTVIHNLSQRYTYRLLDGSMLWRNAEIASTIHVKIIDASTNTVLYDDAALPKRARLEDVDLQHVCAQAQPIVDTFNKAFLEDGAATRLNVEYRLDIGDGQRVYPSQLLPLNGAKGKQLASAQVGDSKERQAIIRDGKMANALRRVDGFHDLDIADLPFEPYGQNLNETRAYRIGRTEPPSIYDVFIKMSKNKELDTNEKHYLLGMLIRGGVFGMKDKKKADSKKEDPSGDGEA